MQKIHIDNACCEWRKKSTMQKRICKCLQKKLYTGEGDGFHKKKNKEELYTKMMGIREGGVSQVRVFKKKNDIGGGGFHKRKKARLAIHKNDGFKKMWIFPGKVCIVSPMFDKIKCISILPIAHFPIFILHYPSCCFPFVHFLGT